MKESLQVYTRNGNKWQTFEEYDGVRIDNLHSNDHDFIMEQFKNACMNKFINKCNGVTFKRVQNYDGTVKCIFTYHSELSTTKWEFIINDR